MPPGTMIIPGAPTGGRSVQVVNVAADWLTAIAAINASKADVGVILLNASVTLTGAHATTCNKNLIVAQGNKVDTDAALLTLTLGNGFLLNFTTANDYIWAKIIGLRIDRVGNNNGFSWNGTPVNGDIEFINCVITSSGAPGTLVTHQFDGTLNAVFTGCTITAGGVCLVQADQNAARVVASSLILTIDHCTVSVTGGSFARLASGDCQVQASVYHSIIRLDGGAGIWETLAGANPRFTVQQDAYSSVGRQETGAGSPFVTFSYLESIANVVHSAAGPVTVYGGFCYTNRGAGAGVTFNLPATAPDGFQVSFVVLAVQNLVVQAGAGDYIDIATTSSSVAGTATSNTPYSRLTLEAIGDGAGNIRWIAKESLGTWVLA